MKPQFWLFTLFFAAFFLQAAPTGYCVPDNGKYHNYFTVAEQLTTLDNLVGMQHMIDMNNSTTSFKGTCYCQTGKNESYDHAYITSVVNPALQPTTSRNNISYYYLNKYLDIGLQIYILGVGYTTVPFDHLPNDIGGTYRCHNGVSSQTTFYSGGSGFIYLYVKKQFTGTITIPSMVMANIYATIDPRTVSNEIISDVIVQGSVTVPQTCEIDEGQAIMIDFKSILASEFSANRRQAVSSRKITRQVNIKCSNMMFTDTLGASFHASAATADSTMVATDNPDVGIKIYDKHNREINVNGGELEAETTKMPVTLEGETLGTLTFSSAPASATGSRPAPGPFNGTATLTIEIGH